VNGSFWALLPGLLVWGFGNGLTFPALFAAAGSGVAPAEQGVASAMANMSRQIGAAVGLAALVAVANAGLDLNAPVAAQAGDVVDGLRTSGLIAALISVVGAVIALAFRRPSPPAPPTPEAATEPAVADSTPAEQAVKTGADDALG
jgi:MFS family permease